MNAIFENLYTDTQCILCICVVILLVNVIKYDKFITIY